MKITKVDIPKSPDGTDGLESIKMEKLGPIVLIAGKNGSGKTRILNKIFKTLNQKPSKKIVETAQRQLVVLDENIKKQQQQIERLQQRAVSDPTSLSSKLRQNKLHSWIGILRTLKNRSLHMKGL